MWRIETLADTVSLGEALRTHGGEGCSVLVWIDVTKKAEWGEVGDWLADRLLDEYSDYRVVLLLTSGENEALQDAALQLSTQLKCDEFWISDAKDASNLIKAHALHEDLRLSFREETRQCSPFELLDETTLAQLVAKELPGLVSSGDGSEGVQQDVPIAGMFLIFLSAVFLSIRILEDP